MNRRTTLKGILAFGVLGTSIFSVFEYIRLNKVPDRRFLLSRENLIAELAEVIIPRTDTPGAKDAQVEEFIINMISDCTKVRNQNLFIEGLKDVEDFCDNHFGRPFHKCSLAEKTQVLTHFENKSNKSTALIGKIERKFLGRPFFSQLKELTIAGFCTSHLGATRALAYDYIPGKFEPCIKLLPQQKSWATK